MDWLGSLSEMWNTEDFWKPMVTTGLAMLPESTKIYVASILNRCGRGRST